MKKLIILYLLMGASGIQFYINGYLGYNIWMPAIIGTFTLSLICIIPNKILSEKLLT